ncbi:MAG: menaquinone biosynthesis protein [Lentisphaeria bacterium]|nr:menaquinone biosynthesis protein [Lentisphaeria bacterium]
MRLGYIDYLNTYPLYWRMFAREALPPGVEVARGKPAELNALMRAGHLDLTPISAACLPDIQDQVYVLPDFCLAATGNVRSVLLVSRLPIEQLDGRKVGLSTASETSAVLLKYLLRQCYEVNPGFVPHPPSPTLQDVDAALVIGNDALQVGEEEYPYTYDLGRLWQERTGLPVVFAVFVVRRDFADAHPEKARGIEDQFRASLAEIRDNRQRFLADAESAYPGVAADPVDYFRVLKYDFSDAFKTSLDTYFELVGKAGLLKPVPKIPFWPGTSSGHADSGLWEQVFDSCEM